MELKSKGIEFPMTDLDHMAPIHTPARVSVPLFDLYIVEIHKFCFYDVHVVLGDRLRLSLLPLRLDNQLTTHNDPQSPFSRHSQ